MRSILFFFFFFFFGSGSDFCPVSTPVALPFSEVGRVQEVIYCVGLRSHLRFCFGFQFPWWDEMWWDVRRLSICIMCAKHSFVDSATLGFPSWPWSLLDTIYIFSIFFLLFSIRFFHLGLVQFALFSYPPLAIQSSSLLLREIRSSIPEIYPNAIPAGRSRRGGE